MTDPKSSKTFVLFHYSFQHLAGTERALINLADTISKLPGYKKIILLLASDSHSSAVSLKDLPVDIEQLNCLIVSTKSGSIDILKMYFQILKKAKLFFKTKDLGKDLTIISSSALLSSVAFLSVEYSKRKLVKFISCEHFSLHVTGSFSKLVRRYFYRYMTVVVLTEKDRLAVEKLFKPLSCICIPNASPFEIDSSHYSPDHKTILAVGRFTAQKGFDLLVDSFSIISKKFPDWKLKIVGDDFGDKAVLERMIAEKQINNIELLPSTTHIEKMYQSASFFVLSSRFEGLPMVLIEAMSFGLPLVAFDCPTGPAEVVNENNGFLVENGNIVEFAERMEILMIDRNLLVQKSKGALEKATAFSKAKIDKLWQKIL